MKPNPRTARPTGVCFSSAKKHALYRFFALSVFIHLFAATLLAGHDFEEVARSLRFGAGQLQVSLRPGVPGQLGDLGRKTGNHQFPTTVDRKPPERASKNIKFGENFESTVVRRVRAESNERSTPQQAEASAEAISAEVMVSYRLELARNSRQFKDIAPEFRRGGLKGIVTLAVEKTTRAIEPSVRIERSSGSEELDRLAVRMLVAALMKTSVPEPLLGRVFAFSMPVEFDFAE